jgi:hypothetical protein
LVGCPVAPFAGALFPNVPGALATVNDQCPPLASVNTVQPLSAQARTCQ